MKNKKNNKNNDIKNNEIFLFLFVPSYQKHRN